MTHIEVPRVAANPAPILSEKDNERAVDIIEQAERHAPTCLCGRHMIAVAEGPEIWLECASQTEDRSGIGALVGRITAFTHVRRKILELPSAN